MKGNKASTYRLVLPVLLGGLCLLALWAVTARGTRAAPLYTPEVDVEAYRGPIAANDAYTVHLPLAFRKHGVFANGGFE